MTSTPIKLNESILSDVSRAREAVEQAERALDGLLEKMQAVSRAEKVTVSRPIEDALQRLHSARNILSTLETAPELLASTDD